MARSVKKTLPHFIQVTLYTKHENFMLVLVSCTKFLSHFPLRITRLSFEPHLRLGLRIAIGARVLAISANSISSLKFLTAALTFFRYLRFHGITLVQLFQVAESNPAPDWTTPHSERTETSWFELNCYAYPEDLFA